MRKTILATVAAGTMTLMATEAAAQSAGQEVPPPARGTGLNKGGSDEVETSFGREWTVREMMSSPESYSKAHSMASIVTQCVVDKIGSDAGTLLGGPMTDDEKYDALAKALKSDHRSCIKAESSGIPMTIVNAALAERVILGESPELEPRAMSLNQNDADAFTTMAPGVKINFDIIGRCAAVYSPGLTYKVLETEPGSDAELDALNSLYKNTPECGLRESPDGAPTGYQRGVLAAGLYHWLHRG